jgi:hypothetical protein
MVPIRVGFGCTNPLRKGAPDMDNAKYIGLEKRGSVLTAAIRRWSLSHTSSADGIFAHHNTS